MVVNQHVESSALVFKMQPAVRSTVDAPRAARIDFVVVTVLRVNAVVVNVPALLLIGNVIQMFVGIVGSVVVMVVLGFQAKEGTIMNVET